MFSVRMNFLIQHQTRIICEMNFIGSCRLNKSVPCGLTALASWRAMPASVFLDWFLKVDHYQSKFSEKYSVFPILYFTAMSESAAFKPQLYNQGLRSSQNALKIMDKIIKNMQYSESVLLVKSHSDNNLRLLKMINNNKQCERLNPL